MFCSGGCGQEETIKHLFTVCDFYGNLWHLVLHWLEIYIAQPSDIGSQRLVGRMCLHEGNLWLFSGDLVGLHLAYLKRAKNFNNKHFSLEQLFACVKFHSCWCLKAHISTKFTVFHSGWTTPSFCICFNTVWWWYCPFFCLEPGYIDLHFSFLRTCCAWKDYFDLSFF